MANCKMCEFYDRNQKNCKQDHVANDNNSCRDFLIKDSLINYNSNNNSINKIALFEKVSYEQFKKDYLNCLPKGFSEELKNEKIITSFYNNIKLPKRATVDSAGYDFFIPFARALFLNEIHNIPTGIRCKINKGWVLQLYPRSGYGFKYGLKLANTVGIIDGDYYYAKNEGHIMVKLANTEARLQENIYFETGQAFCQGIFVPYGITVDDETDGVRTGGFGSTDTINKER